MSEKSVTIGMEQSEIALEHHGSTWKGGGRELEVIALRADEIEVRVDGKIHTVPFLVQGSLVSFSFDGTIWQADVADKGARVRARHRDHSTSAPMPGMVLKILVAVGDSVAKGAPLLILEAMKMEHQIVAPRDGNVVSINCAEGEMVQPGVDLVDVAE